MAKLRLLLMLPLLLVIGFGCGKKSATPAKVSGSVKYKGAIVKAGSVVFHSKDAGVFNAPIREDGTYLPTSLPTGEMVVTIETESSNPDVKQPVYGGGKAATGSKTAESKGTAESILSKAEGLSESPAAKAMAASAAKRPNAASMKANYVKIPSKYSNPKTSGLTVNLSPGNQTKDFDLND